MEDDTPSTYVLESVLIRTVDHAAATSLVPATVMSAVPQAILPLAKDHHDAVARGPARSTAGELGMGFVLDSASSGYCLHEPINICKE